jgi:hypothetical protein
MIVANATRIAFGLKNQSFDANGLLPHGRSCAMTLANLGTHFTFGDISHRTHASKIRRGGQPVHRFHLIKMYPLM